MAHARHEGRFHRSVPQHWEKFSFRPDSGHCLRIYSSADLHVVSGIVDNYQFLRAEYPLIRVTTPVGDDRYFEIAKKCPELFSFSSRNQRIWAEAHLVAMRTSNTVLTIGGLGMTHQAGLAAIVARKRLIPIASFGGASGRLLETLEQIGEASHQDLLKLNGPWTQHTLDTALRLVQGNGSVRILIVHGRSRNRDDLDLLLRTECSLTDNVVRQETFSVGATLP